MDNQGNMTITSANSVVTLKVAGLYNAPVRLEGFSSDAIAQPAQVNPVVAEMGADGHMSVGFVPTPKTVTFAFAADSPSRQIMEDWYSAQEALREVLLCEVEVSTPAINRKYTGLRGALTTAQPGVQAQQTLRPSQYVITFESWTGSAL